MVVGGHCVNGGHPEKGEEAEKIGEGVVLLHDTLKKFRESF